MTDASPIPAQRVCGIPVRARAFVEMQYLASLERRRGQDPGRAKQSQSAQAFAGYLSGCLWRRKILRLYGVAGSKAPITQNKANRPIADCGLSESPGRAKQSQSAEHGGRGQSCETKPILPRAPCLGRVLIRSGLADIVLDIPPVGHIIAGVSICRVAMP